jgi:hypothetical protein
MKPMPSWTRCHADLNRRAFIRAGYLSLLGLGVGDYLRGRSVLAADDPKPRAQSFILVRLEGGLGLVESRLPQN